MGGSKTAIIDDDELKCIRLAHAQASVKFLQGHVQSENLILMKSQISRLKHKCSHYTLFCFQIHIKGKIETYIAVLNTLCMLS